MNILKELKKLYYCNIKIYRYKIEFISMINHRNKKFLKKYNIDYDVDLKNQVIINFYPVIIFIHRSIKNY